MKVKIEYIAGFVSHITDVITIQLFGDQWFHEQKTNKRVWFCSNVTKITGLPLFYDTVDVTTYFANIFNIINFSYC